jgi:hypothetical protein
MATEGGFKIHVASKHSDAVHKGASFGNLVTEDAAPTEESTTSQPSWQEPPPEREPETVKTPADDDALSAQGRRKSPPEVRAR